MQVELLFSVFFVPLFLSVLWYRLEVKDGRLASLL